MSIETTKTNFDEKKGDKSASSSPHSNRVVENLANIDINKSKSSSPNNFQHHSQEKNSNTNTNNSFNSSNNKPIINNNNNNNSNNNTNNLNSFSNVNNVIRTTALPHHIPKLESLSKKMDEIRKNIGDEVFYFFYF
jgi:hypothetical protein